MRTRTSTVFFFKVNFKNKKPWGPYTNPQGLNYK